MQQLTGQDAMFLHMEVEGFPMHIGGVSIYDQSTAPHGVVRFKDILRTFEERSHRSPIFRRKLMRVPFNLDQPYWIDDEDYDLEFHLRHIALPKPGDWRQLCIQVARLHARPLDQNRPLWEAYVIEGLDNVEGVPEGSFALYLKVHHAAMDGASGTQFFGAFNDITPVPPKVEKPAPWSPVPRPATSSLLMKAYLNNLRKPARFISLARQIGPSRRRLQEGRDEGLFHESDEKAITRFNGKLTAHRVVDAVRFDFEQIRAIKNSVEGATINDAVLSIVSAAMRKYLASKGELPEQNLYTACPIDVRDESEREAGGNMIGMMNVDLCTDITDPAELLRQIHLETQEAKAYAEALGPRIGMDVAETVPVGIQANIVQIALRAGLAEKNVMMNTVVTNVPGAPCQLYLCGAQIVDSFGMGPLSPGMGLFHTVNSAVMKKKGTISIAFIACREVLPDPEFYAECIQNSFDELYAATVNGRQAKAKTRARPKAKTKTRPRARKA